MVKFWIMPPTTRSLSSPPSTLVSTARPSLPLMLTLPTRDLVGS